MSRRLSGQAVGLRLPSMRLARPKRPQLSPERARPSHWTRKHAVQYSIPNTCIPPFAGPGGRIVMVPRYATSATDPCKPRCTAWYCSAPRASSSRPKRPPALACRSSSGTSSTPFLECGILAHGFVFLHGADCGHDKRSNDLVLYLPCYSFGSWPRRVFGGCRPLCPRAHHLDDLATVFSVHHKITVQCHHRALGMQLSKAHQASVCQ